MDVQVKRANKAEIFGCNTTVLLEKMLRVLFIWMAQYSETIHVNFKKEQEWRSVLGIGLLFTVRAKSFLVSFWKIGGVSLIVDRCF